MKRICSCILVLLLVLSLSPASFAADEYGIGDIWTVDGLLSMEILSVTETQARNEYTDKNPSAVYIVTYAYTNLGYKDDYDSGLYIGIDDQIVDAGGAMGYSYPGDKTYYAKETPVGATCYAQECIGVDNPGNFKIYVSKYDADYNQYKAVFNIDLSAPSASLDNTTPLEPFEGAFRTGETWTVDGQWSLTINGVTEITARNQYSELAPAAVYLVDYTYTNLGYEDEYSDGLFMSIEDCVVDNVGFMAYSYPGDQTYYAQETPVGATCKAQECIGVFHPGNLQFVVTKYDGNDVRHSACFYIEVA